MILEMNLDKYISVDQGTVYQEKKNEKLHKCGSALLKMILFLYYFNFFFWGGGVKLIPIMNLHGVCKYRIYNVTEVKYFYIMKPLLHLYLIIEFSLHFKKTFIYTKHYLKL